jgi:hypothetical protein
MRCSFAILVLPSELYPVARRSDIACHLDCRRLELIDLERQRLAGFRSDPVGDVVFMDGRGADGRPTQEILVSEI